MARLEADKRTSGCLWYNDEIVWYYLFRYSKSRPEKWILHRQHLAYIQVKY